MKQALSTTKIPHARSLRNGADFADAGLIPADQAAMIDDVARRYAVALTPILADLIDRQDDSDPIARQFIPDLRELQDNDLGMADPIGDQTHSPLRGIVHRYPDRVLLTPLLHCPVYCRFCFRRERVGGPEKSLSEAELAAAIGYIAANAQIWEVVITGGDPLMLPPGRMSSLMTALEAIPHLQIIRLHSRIPVADPERVNEAMVQALSRERIPVWLAVHANHAKEFSAPALAALRRLSQAGIPLIGQTVLLRGVNDRFEILRDLFRTMVANRIKPYYLHQLDRAQGTEHFRVPVEQGQSLMRELRGRLSGLCQPTYVLDIPGGHGKVPIGPTYLADGTATDWRGTGHDYEKGRS